jgi:hypothetical protein
MRIKASLNRIYGFFDVIAYDDYSIIISLTGTKFDHINRNIRSAKYYQEAGYVILLSGDSYWLSTYYLGLKDYFKLCECCYENTDD